MQFQVPRPCKIAQLKFCLTEPQHLADIQLSWPRYVIHATWKSRVCSHICHVNPGLGSHISVDKACDEAQMQVQPHKQKTFFDLPRELRDTLYHLCSARSSPRCGWIQAAISQPPRHLSYHPQGSRAHILGRPRPEPRALLELPTLSR